jgi:hypothetical protein
MNRILPAMLVSGAILAAGILVIRHQRAQIAASQPAARASSAAKQKGVVPTTGSARKPLSAASGVAPAAKISTGSAKAAAFLKTVDEKARPLIEMAEREAVASRARHECGRAALVLGLSSAEGAALQQHVESQTPAIPARAVREWIQARLGADAAAGFERAEAARRTAAVEHGAQEAIFRLSRIVDLTPEQKDRLYDGFVEKGNSRTEEPAARFQLSTAFSLKDTPSIPDPTQLGRSILTPEQLEFLDAASAQEKDAIRESTAEVMTQLMPVLLTALQEAAGDKP